MEGKHYRCKYCYQEFVPTRRHVQKFCSNSCRSKAHHIKNRNNVTQRPAQSPSIEAEKAEKMNMPGIGNAAVGSMAADAAKSILTAPDNKPATKGDIKVLLNRMERYHRVLNLPLRADNYLPYFDLDTKNIVFFENSLRAKMAK